MNLYHLILHNKQLDLVLHQSVFSIYIIKVYLNFLVKSYITLALRIMMSLHCCCFISNTKQIQICWSGKFEIMEIQIKYSNKNIVVMLNFKDLFSNLKCVFVTSMSPLLPILCSLRLGTFWFQLRTPQCTFSGMRRYMKSFHIQIYISVRFTSSFIIQNLKFSNNLA